MAALICGSLAFDTIATFPRPLRRPDPARAAAHPERLVPGARRCAASSAAAPATSPTTCAALGGEPVVIAAVGSDGGDYRRAPARRGASTTDARARRSPTPTRRRRSSSPTSTTTRSPRSTPGAMQSAHEIDGAGAAPIWRSAIVAPDGRDAMLRPRRASSPPPASRSSSIRARACRCSTAPSCALRRAGELGRGQRLRGADAVPSAPGCTLEAMSRSHLRGIVVTLGAAGLRAVAATASAPTCPASRRASVVDPTGCGDAFRAALLYGLERGWPLERCAALGNRLGALKIASRGGQNHVLDRTIRRGLSRASSSSAESVRSPQTMDIRPSASSSHPSPSSSLRLPPGRRCRWLYGRKLVAAAAAAEEERQEPPVLAAADGAGDEADRGAEEGARGAAQDRWSRPRPAASARRELEEALLAAEKRGRGRLRR